MIKHTEVIMMLYYFTFIFSYDHKGYLKKHVLLHFPSYSITFNDILSQSIQMDKIKFHPTLYLVSLRNTPYYERKHRFKRL